MRLIPAIDLRGGCCVRLLQGRFDAETVYATDPADIVALYRGWGASYLHVVDLDGARDGGRTNRDAVAALAGRTRDVSIQVGGGVRTQEIAAELLALGAERVVVGSVAVTQPAAVETWIREFGADRIVLAFDVRLDGLGMPRLTTHGWEQQTEANLWDAVANYAAHGASHVLCTDVARDGALSGPNVALYAEATRRFPSVQWQASGGVGSGDDLRALADTGVAAAISGRALLEGRIPAKELAPFLPNA
jgi:phosphoribosylformimino-5-aminoimidazole carboxamide ribotide isomerase